jgi:hypothetical protein
MVIRVLANLYRFDWEEVLAVLYGMVDHAGEQGLMAIGKLAVVLH